ncbi:MAG: MMPL family transporter [Candidatus Heimdallarchaeota archaeon]|nr:MMPL family transporter [Candidatus Heimdallarchaeota archaeon]
MISSKNLTNLIDKGKIPIIIFWFLFTVTIVVNFAPNFLNVTTNEFKPPDGTDAANGQVLMNEYFPTTSTQEGHLIVAHTETSSIIGDELRELTLYLVEDLFSTYPIEYRSASGYYIFDNTDLDSLKYQFVSEDNQTSFIQLTFNADQAKQQEITHYIREKVDEFHLDQIEVYTTGQSALQIDTDESIERDLSKIDSITIPIVFIAIAILLKNWRYFLITFFPVVMTIGITFGILERLIVNDVVTIQSFVPSVLISLVLGISVDYSLFLLTRFREERLNGKSVLNSVQKMMKHAGHTVFTSGLTLTICMLGLIFFPVVMLSSVGYAISIGIILLLTINLTLTPSLLLLFGNWIEKERKTEEKTSDNSEKSTSKSFWYKIGWASTKYNVLLLGIILLLTLPLATRIIDTTPDSQVEFFAPRGSDSAIAFNYLQEDFGPGAIAPVNIIVVPNEGNVWTSSVFSDLHYFINKALQQTEIEERSVFSHTYLNGSAIAFEIAMAFTTLDSGYYNLSQAQLYRQFSSQYVSSTDGKENAAALVQIILPVDPFAPQAKEIVDQLEQIAHDTFTEKYSFGFTGSTATSKEIIDETYSNFPMMIILVIISIYALVGIMFRAIVLPARLITTVGLTIAFIYGAAQVVFEENTFVNSIFPSLDGVSVVFWMVPVMSFSIILGLGIDYDIFTIERIKENVWDGMPNNEAIAQGIDKTARVITGAGIIMMIAFGGMMFSTSYILMQFGFVLSFAVLLDTFLVRTVLVPAIMSFAEKLNWWPNKPPNK